MQPTKSITKYDSQTKQSIGFQRLTSDEWINTINKAVNNNRQQTSIENNDSVLYNKTESESGINGEVQRGRMARVSEQFDTRLQQNSQQQQTKKYTRAEYEQWEKSIRPIEENNITIEQKNKK